MKNVTLMSICLGLLLCVCPLAAEAAYPEKPVVLVVGYGAGGVTDIPARAFASVFSKELGVNVIVKNVTGASGVTGNAEVANAVPDGYTLLYGPLGPMAMYPHLQKLPYTQESYVPIFRILQDYNVLWTPKNAPWTDFASMVEVVRKNPGKYFYGTTGINNPSHMANLLLFKKLGLEVGTLPGNGTTACIQSMNAGNIHFLGDMPPTGRTFDLVPLGVYAHERVGNLPEIPTFKELGVDLPESYVWQGIFAPKGTPQAVVDVLETAGKRTVNSPELAALLEKFGSRPAYLGQKEFSALVKNELDRQRDIYIQAGVLKQ